MNLRRVGKRVMMASAALLLFGAAPRAHAGSVTNLNDSGAGSLRDAIATAAPGDTINFAPDLIGTIPVSSAELDINKSLTINGPGAPVLEISGTNSRRVFDITDGNAVVTIRNLTITEGLANDGAGIYNSGNLTLSNCVVFNNHSNGPGGGISNRGDLSMSDCVVYLNEAQSGGGLDTGGFFGGGNVQMTRCFFHSNNVSYSGAAIRSIGSTITVNESTISGNGVNSSTGAFDTFAKILGGGALLNTGSGSATFNNCTISGNLVSASALQSGGALAGGGIANAAGPVVLHNCTVADNQVLSTATTTIPAQGGGIYNSPTDGATATLGSTLVARNTASTGPDFRGPAISQGFNLIGKRDASSGFTQATDRTGTVASPLDAKLDAGLQNNGGPTPTILFLPGSPALDKGKNFVGASKDQRGKLRPYDNSGILNAAGGDGSDIGAVEIQAPGVAVSNPSSTNEGGATAPGTVNFAITLSAPAPQTVVVNYTTTDGTAIAGSDYVAKSGRVSFAAGETSKLIAVIFIGDSQPEANENFYLDLSSPTNATIADSRGVTSIRNDDGPGLTISDATPVSEGNSGLTEQTFIVRLRSPSTDTITVNWATADGTARSDDYVAAAGTLTFAPGQTSKLIKIQVKGDTTVEPNETYKVNLSAPSFAVLSDAQAIGTINNDDAAPLLFQNDEPSQ